MKRREFVKTSAIGALGVGLTMQGCHKNDSRTVTSESKKKKKVTLEFHHDLTYTQEKFYNSLDTNLKNAIDALFDTAILSTTPLHKADDTVYIVDRNIKKMSKRTTLTAPAKSASNSSGGSVIYYHETEANANSFAVYMIYKKMETFEDDDPFYEGQIYYNDHPFDGNDIDTANKPKYKLIGLQLVVYDENGEQVNITEDYAVETTKALLLSMGVFSKLESKHMKTIVENFDFKSTKLYAAINYVISNNHGWYRYQRYKDDNGATLIRKSDVYDKDGNLLFAKGDAIYTYPLRDIFEKYLKESYKELIHTLSKDSTIGPLLLPKAKNTASNSAPALKKAAAKFSSILYKKSKTFNNVTYDIGNESLGHQGYEVAFKKVDGDGVHISVTNKFYRHGFLYCAFVDADGKAVFPPDSEITMKYDANGNEKSSYKGYEFLSVTNPTTGKKESVPVLKINLLSPVQTLMAIPLVDTTVSFALPIPDNAIELKAFMASLSFNDGHASDFLTTDTPMSIKEIQQEMLKIPEVTTITFEMALNAFFLAMGATYGPSKDFVSLMASTGIKFALQVAGVFISHPHVRGADAFRKILPILGTTLVRSHLSIAEYLAESLAESEVEDSVPLVGQIIRVVNMSFDAALLAEAIVDTAITNPINHVVIYRKHTLKIDLFSDPNNHQFPLELDDESDVTVQLKYGSAQKVTHKRFKWGEVKNTLQTITSDGGATKQQVALEIEDQPVGGFVEIDIKMIANSGFVLAHANAVRKNLANTTHQLTITQNKIPLSSSTVYSHYAKYTQDANKNYIWKKTTTPPTYDAAYEAHYNLNKIDINDPIGAVAYSYKDNFTNNYVVRSVSAIVDAVPTQKSRSVSEKTLIELSMLSRDSKTGHFIFDFDDAADVVYVRKADINLQTNSFDVDTTKNVGIFSTSDIDFISINQKHKIAVGLDKTAGVLHVLDLLDEGVLDTEPSRYKTSKSVQKTMVLQTGSNSIGSGINSGNVSGENIFKTQYLNNPIAMTIDFDGNIILIDTNSGKYVLRVFDRFGIVKTEYDGFVNGIFTLKEENGVEYLDISVESKGYIYVLKKINGTYKVDVYNPSSATPYEPEITVDSFNAGKMEVDFWRNIYALNFEPTDTTDAINPNKEFDPSLSIWIPSLPGS